MHELEMIDEDRYGRASLPVTCKVCGEYTTGPCSLWNRALMLEGMTSTLANSLRKSICQGSGGLAVGRGLQADVLLEVHRLTDRLVLGRTQLFG